MADINGWLEGYKSVFRAVLKSRITIAIIGGISLLSISAAHAVAGTLTLGRSNWAGYVAIPAQGQTITSTTGTFTVPTLDCSDANQQTGTKLLQVWNGIDGGEPSFPVSIEQVGINAVCNNGVQTNPDFFYLQYTPAKPKQVNFVYGTIPLAGSILIPTGDSLTATTSHVGNQVTVTLTDNTRGLSGSATAKCPAGSCLFGSAENIVEATGKIATFDSVTFTNSTATDSKGHTGGLYTSKPWWNTFEPSMIGGDAQGNQAICAVPGVYDLNLNSFSVTSTKQCYTG